jgi:hypothetical protein
MILKANAQLISRTDTIRGHTTCIFSPKQNLGSGFRVRVYRLVTVNFKVRGRVSFRVCLLSYSLACSVSPAHIGSAYSLAGQDRMHLTEKQSD